LPSQAGANTATNAGTSTLPDSVMHHLPTNLASSSQKPAGVNMVTSADINISLVLTHLVADVDLVVVDLAGPDVVPVAVDLKAVDPGTEVVDPKVVAKAVDPKVVVLIMATRAAVAVAVHPMAMSLVSSLPKMVGASMRTLVNMLMPFQPRNQTHHLHRLAEN